MWFKMPKLATAITSDMQSYGRHLNSGLFQGVPGLLRWCDGASNLFINLKFFLHKNILA